MSLPTSFFHTRVPLGGGGWVLQFDGSTSHYIGGTRQTIRYNDTQGYGYTVFDDSGGFGGQRSAHLIKFNKDGVVQLQAGVHRGGGFEVRSFDVFDNGGVVLMGEYGGETYIHVVDSTSSISAITNANGKTLYSGQYWETLAAYNHVGNTYPYKIAAMGRRSSDQSGLGQIYGWDGTTTFTDTGNMMRSYQSGQVVQPREVTVRPDTRKIAMAGRYHNNVNITASGAIFTQNFGGMAMGSHINLGNISSTGFHLGVCWHKGLRNIAANTNDAAWLVGYKDSSGNKGTIGSMSSAGFGNNFALIGTTPYNADNFQLNDVAYSDVSNDNKVYAVGQMRSPLDARNASGGGTNANDGVIICFNVSDDLNVTPTIAWATGIYQTQSGLQRHISLQNVVVDDEGQLLIRGEHYGESTQAAQRMFILRHPPSGAVSATAGTLNLYDATQYLTVTSASGNQGTLNFSNGSFWSEQTHTPAVQSQTLGSGTLTEF